MVAAGQADLSGSPEARLAIEVVSALGVVVAVVAVVLAVLWSPRRSNERPRTDRKLPSMRFWRPQHFSLALGHLQVLCRQWKEGAFHQGDIRGTTTEWDLVRWILQLSLTCASNMAPQSLGKANLFRISQIKRDADGRPESVKVYSSEFDGVFSLRQLVNQFDPKLLRDLSLNHDQDTRPAALQCVIDERPLVQSLQRRSSNFDDPERSLGVTHVVALPLVRNFGDVIPDQPVSIAVDLRFSRLTAWMVDRLGYRQRTLVRRAGHISAALMDVTAIKDPRFLPPSDARPETGNLLGALSDVRPRSPAAPEGGSALSPKPRPNEGRRGTV